MSLMLLPTICSCHSAAYHHKDPSVTLFPFSCPLGCLCLAGKSEPPLAMPVLYYKWMYINLSLLDVIVLMGCGNWVGTKWQGWDSAFGHPSSWLSPNTRNIPYPEPQPPILCCAVSFCNQGDFFPCLEVTGGGGHCSIRVVPGHLLVSSFDVFHTAFLCSPFVLTPRTLPRVWEHEASYLRSCRNTKVVWPYWSQSGRESCRECS